MQTNTPCEIILADGAGHTNAHPQQLGYLTNPLAIVPRCEHPLVQILRISPASLGTSIPASGLPPLIPPGLKRSKAANHEGNAEAHRGE